MGFRPDEVDGRDTEVDVPDVDSVTIVEALVSIVVVVVHGLACY